MHTNLQTSCLSYLKARCQEWIWLPCLGIGALVAGCSSGSGSSTVAPPVLPPPAVNTAGEVVVTGLAQVGETLSATVTDANGLTTSTLVYQWQLDGTDIDGSTAAMLLLTTAQSGGSVQLQVTYTDDDGFSETVVSTLSAPVADAPVAVGPGNFVRGSVGDNDSVPDIRCDTVLSSASALESAATRDMTPGVTVCLSAGSYTNLNLDFGGQGTADMPITIAAQEPGQVIVDGEVSVRMSGEYVVLQGFVFLDANSEDSDFLQTRDGSSRELCNHCRIVDNSFIDIDQLGAPSNKWISIYGQFNRVDHNWFSGKTNEGALLVVIRRVPDGELPSATNTDYAQIDHNYFGDRAPADGKVYGDGGDNGFEAIRLGTSDSHSADSLSVLEYNYFERIDAETEVISNKSGSNRIFNNTIRDSYGSLTLRHGASALVAANFIFGDGHPFAGGIRVIDDSHRVVNNYVEGVRFLGTRFHGGIALHSSDNSTTNGYQILTNVLVANNTIVDSVSSLNVNAGTRSIDPEGVVVANNVIADAVGPVITYTEEGMPENSIYAGNYVFGSSFSDSPSITAFSGFTVVDIGLSDDELGVDRVSASSASIVAQTGFDSRGFDPVSDDMDGQIRTGQTNSGADHVSDDAAVIGVLTPFDVGPMAYTPPTTAPVITRVPISNPGFDRGDEGWQLTGAASVTNDIDETFSRRASLKIQGADGRATQSLAVEPGRQYEFSAFASGPSRLGVSAEGVEVTQDANVSDYQLLRVAFTAGASGTVDLFAALDDTIAQSAAVRDANFDGFAGRDGDWTVTEGAGIGQVQGSSNSASGVDGSAKFKYNDASEVGRPAVSQLVDVMPNTDYVLSAYFQTNSSAGPSATLGAYVGSTTTVLASDVFDPVQLEADGAPVADDRFRRGSIAFNSGSATRITLFVEYVPNSIIADGGVPSETEMRVDDVRLSFSGAPTDSDPAFFDGFRVVGYPVE